LDQDRTPPVNVVWLVEDERPQRRPVDTFEDHRFPAVNLNQASNLGARQPG
jgi:hypothetical protein